jgi:hypothetical protein
MFSDIVLSESLSLRDERLAQIDESRAIELLVKVKLLVLAVWRDTQFATTDQVAEFFEVPKETIASLVKNNRTELARDGYVVLRGDDLQFAKFKLDFANKSKVRQVAIWTPRSIIRAGMLLRYSDVAATLRTLILDGIKEIPSLAAKSVEKPRPIVPPTVDQLTSVTQLLKTAGLPQSYIERLAISNLRKYYPETLSILPESREMGSLVTTQALLTPTQIGDALDVRYSTGRGNAEYVNKILSYCGYQILVGGRWSATEKANGYVDRKPVITNSRTAKDQLLWSAEIIPILSEAIQSYRESLLEEPCPPNEVPESPATPWSPVINYSPPLNDLYPNDM